jgi:hypothetical protein
MKQFYVSAYLRVLCFHIKSVHVNILDENMPVVIYSGSLPRLTVCGSISCNAFEFEMLLLYELNLLLLSNKGSLCEPSDKLPYSIRILLESAIRNCDNFQVTTNDVEKIIDWENTAPKLAEIPFKPARVLLQVCTGDRAN